MLSKTEQRKYFDKRWKVLHQHFQFFFSSKDPEELHQVRVEIKKINALLFFSRHGSKNKILLNKIFKHAGLIRNTQVNLQLLDNYKITNKVFTKQQQQYLIKESQQFLQNHSLYSTVLKETYTTISDDFEAIKNHSISSIYKKQFRKIATLLFKNDKNHDLHTCRKKIKKLLYVYDILDKSLKSKLNLNTSYLDQLQTTIGKWHDASIASELFKTNMPIDKQIINKLEKQLQTLQQTIQSLSKNFPKKIVLK